MDTPLTTPASPIPLSLPRLRAADRMILAVCGLPRSGNSLVMQMLEAGGMDCVGSYPMYEQYNAFKDAGWEEYLTFSGKAVKLLSSPLYQPLPKIPQRFILVSRDPKERFKSWLKFTEKQDESRKWKRAVYRELGRKHERLWRALRQCGAVIELRFEELLECPRSVAAFLALVYDSDTPIDIDAMVDAVVERTPECLEGFLEFDQLRESGNL